MKKYDRVLRYYKRHADEWCNTPYCYLEEKLINFCNVPYGQMLIDSDWGCFDARRAYEDILYGDHNDLEYCIVEMLSCFVQYIDKFENRYNSVLTKDNKDYIRLCSSCEMFFDNSEVDTDDMPCDMRHATEEMCMGCVSDMWKVCGECGRWVSENYITYINNGRQMLCRTCHDEIAVECENCKRSITKDMITEEEAVVCCKYCRNSIKEVCSNCGADFLVIDRLPGWDKENSYCDRCLFDKCNYSSHVYKPNSFTFRTIKSERKMEDTLFFGLELEFEIMNESRDEIAQQIKEKYSFDELYLTHDGSLDYGLEAVLMPFSKLWYKDNKQYLSNLYSEIVQLGCVFDKDTIGTHIHTSKSAWSALSIYKLVHFLYDANNNFSLKKIYGRGATKHSQYRESELYGAAKLAKAKKNVNERDHYNMINLSCKNTLEFRMFGSSSSVDNVFNYIDFVQSVHEFVSEHSISYMEMNYYKSFLEKQGNKYINLLKELER